MTPAENFCSTASVEGDSLSCLQASLVSGGRDWGGGRGCRRLGVGRQLEGSKALGGWRMARSRDLGAPVYLIGVERVSSTAIIRKWRVTGHPVSRAWC